MSNKNSKQQNRENNHSFWETMADKFSDLVVSCVEPIAKAFVSVAIIVATAFGMTSTAIFAENRYLPFVILGVATVAFIFTWRNNSRSQTKENNQHIKDLQKQVDQLTTQLEDYNERIGNIEMLETFENRLASKEVEKRHSNLQSKIPLSDSDMKEMDDTSSPPPSPIKS